MQADKAIAVSMHLNLHTLAFNLIHCLSRQTEAAAAPPAPESLAASYQQWIDKGNAALTWV